MHDETLTRTKQGNQMDFEDMDPALAEEVHEIFVAECAKHGTPVDMSHAALDFLIPRSLRMTRIRALMRIWPLVMSVALAACGSPTASPPLVWPPLRQHPSQRQHRPGR
jgi:hypothetical protein